MSLPQIVGHDAVRASLIRAHQANRLPQVLLLTGEYGVGKQRLGLWIAQLALCSGGSSPCGQCRPCRLVNDLIHPDLHWFVPLPRPKAGDLDKQVEEVKESLAELIQSRRDKPSYSPSDGMALHGVASARLILRTASLTTVEGGRRVIVIGEADRLVPQESSPDAANALLKFLEEPPASTIVVLTATEPTRVLPTIRSRSVPIRLGRLSDDAIATALARLEPSLSTLDCRARAREAQGSLGRALNAATREGRSRAVDELLDAIKQGGAAPFERALRQGPWQARGDFSTLLDGLSVTLAGATRALLGGADATADIPAALRSVRDPGRLLAAQQHVEDAREKARGNVNPQLLLAVLNSHLGEALWA